MLYMPRGTVHCAVTEADAPSCHITLSTYQQWNYGSLAAHLLQRLLESQGGEAHLPLELRRGLPPSFISMHGLQQDAAHQQPRSGRQQSRVSCLCRGAKDAAALQAHFPGSAPMALTVWAKGTCGGVGQAHRRCLLQIVEQQKPWQLACASLRMPWNGDLDFYPLPLTAWLSTS